MGTLALQSYTLRLNTTQSPHPESRLLWLSSHRHSRPLAFVGPKSEYLDESSLASSMYTCLWELHLLDLLVDGHDDVNRLTVRMRIELEDL